ncbi:MAG: hypothetical protein WDO69_23745 [Pseudomonadota bacterium]
MRFFSVRSLALATLVPALLLFVFVPGCAKQSEGERCGDIYGPENDDCGDGLTCTLLSTGADPLRRCCYTDGHITDSRCEPQTTTSVGGASSGGAGTGGSGVAGGSTEAEAGAGGS